MFSLFRTFLRHNHVYPLLLEIWNWMFDYELDTNLVNSEALSNEKSSPRWRCTGVANRNNQLLIRRPRPGAGCFELGSGRARSNYITRGQLTPNSTNNILLFCLHFEEIYDRNCSSFIERWDFLNFIAARRSRKGI